jgi:PTH1 family peptidyl-tRNA hydrolase
MKLIVGLGNPGKQYENTRHNIGFWAVDRLRDDLKADGVVFFKNTSFVNDSGVDVRKTINRLKTPLEDLLVIHDDFDLELGQFKMQFGRSDAGHKGVRSIINELGSRDFWRLRIGTGKLPEGVDADDYVLDRFPPSEQQVLDSLYPQILDKVRDWVLKD